MSSTFLRDNIKSHYRQSNAEELFNVDDNEGRARANYITGPLPKADIKEAIFDVNWATEMLHPLLTQIREEETIPLK